MSEESTRPDPVTLTRGLGEAQGVDATMRFFGRASVYDMSPFGLHAFERADRVIAYPDIEEARAAAERLAQKRE